MDGSNDASGTGIDGAARVAREARSPYEPTNKARLWPTGGLMLRAAQPVSERQLAEAIEPRFLTVPLPVRPTVSGYLPFQLGEEHDVPTVFALSGGGFTALRLGHLSRDVPKAARVQAAQRALKAARERAGRPLPDFEAKQIEAQAYCELLAQALVEERENTLYYRHDLGLLFAADRSSNGAKESAKFFDSVLPSHACESPKFAQPPSEAMTKWLLDQTPPDGFRFGTSALLTGPHDARAKFDNHDLTCDEVLEHLHAGLRVSELSLVHQNRVQFTLTEKGLVRSIALLGVELDEELSGLTASLAEAAVYVNFVFPAICAAYAAIGGSYGRGSHVSPFPSIEDDAA